MVAKGFPAITYALRGLIYFELRVEAADTDLHSGNLGGIAANPAQALAEILVRLKDSAGHILIPGFYDGVRPLTDDERRQFARIPFDEAGLKKTYGLTALQGEAGFTPTERNWARPTLDVNGIWGGYQGPGTKTIIPAWAAAKLSCRLVPDQDPKAVGQALRRYIDEVHPKAVRVSLTELSGHGDPWITPVDHPLIRAGQRALGPVYGKDPALVRGGGSIGAVEVMARLLDTPCLLVGFVLPDSFQHAPNERLDLDSFYLGRKAALRLWQEIAAIKNDAVTGSAASASPGSR
jgi:acetylornithine deacetylase/succinyl-diaminopimelate desuccinylase-like protein